MDRGRVAIGHVSNQVYVKVLNTASRPNQALVSLLKEAVIIKLKRRKRRERRQQDDRNDGS